MTGFQMRELVDAFIESRRAQHLSPHTVDWYRWILSGWVRVAPTAEASAGDVERWLVSAPSTESARTWLRALRAFYSWADRRYGVSNPAGEVRPPPGRRLLPRVFTEAELRRIVGAATDPRDRAAVITLLDTGIRIGELASIRVEDIELRCIVVTGKTGQRRVPISPETHRALMAIARPMGPVFTWLTPSGEVRPMAVGTLNLRIREVIRRAGVSGRKVGPHTFRHTFATLYLRAGGDIYRLQRILGHSHIRQTMVYLHLSDPDVASEHARLTPLRLVTEPRQFTLEEGRGTG